MAPKSKEKSLETQAREAFDHAVKIAQLSPSADYDTIAGAIMTAIKTATKAAQPSAPVANAAYDEAHYALMAFIDEHVGPGHIGILKERIAEMLSKQVVAVQAYERAEARAAAYRAANAEAPAESRSPGCTRCSGGACTACGRKFSESTIRRCLEATRDLEKECDAQGQKEPRAALQWLAAKFEGWIGEASPPEWPSHRAASCAKEMKAVRSEISELIEKLNGQMDTVLSAMLSAKPEPAPAARTHPRQLAWFNRGALTFINEGTQPRWLDPQTPWIRMPWLDEPELPGPTERERATRAEMDAIYEGHNISPEMRAKLDHDVLMQQTGARDMRFSIIHELRELRAENHRGRNAGFVQAIDAAINRIERL